jgi:hypothetical protein
MKEIDFTLSLNNQAWAVLHYLVPYAWDDLPMEWLRTLPWYNCRERGFALVVKPTLPLQHIRTSDDFVVAFAESRNTDMIVVVCYERVPVAYDIPNANDPGYKEGYKEEASFEAGEISKAADYIFDRIEGWLKKNSKKKAG